MSTSTLSGFGRTLEMCADMMWDSVEKEGKAVSALRWGPSGEPWGRDIPAATVRGAYLRRSSGTHLRFSGPV